MANIQTILSITTATLGFLATTLTLIYNLVKNIKAKKRAENVIKIGDAIIPYIEQAEKFPAYSSIEKKEYGLGGLGDGGLGDGVLGNFEVCKK